MPTPRQSKKTGSDPKPAKDSKKTAGVSKSAGKQQTQSPGRKTRQVEPRLKTAGSKADSSSLPSKETHLSGKRKEILAFIDEYITANNFPPSVREIGEAVHLTSPSSVHSQLKTLHNGGFLKRHPDKPRALEVCWVPGSEAVLERRAARHVPLVGDVAAGTNVLAQQNFEETLPLPEDFTGQGQLFMLRVRGLSMINMGILDGDYVVADYSATPTNGDIVVAGIPGEEATVKILQRKGSKLILRPANDDMEDLIFTDQTQGGEVTIYGKVVTVIRRL